MADLCGPSNALQNFQKHTSVDRTLQQDRLTNRHSPAQGFRSSSNSNAGILDPEFDAFQAGHAGRPQPDLRFHDLPGLAPQFAHTPQAPDWASDFQRLNISPQSTPIQRHLPPQSSNAAAAWHQDFMRQQSPTGQASTRQSNMFGGMSGQGMAWAGPSFQQGPAFGAMNGTSSLGMTQGKQPVQEMVPEFDEAAFERAFQQAQQDVLDHEASNQEGIQKGPQQVQRENEENFRALQGEQRKAVDAFPPETDPVLLRIRESRPAVYATLKLRSAVDLGRSVEDAHDWLARLEEMERSATLTLDASEAKWSVDALKKIIQREASPDIKERTEHLITEINQRLMSQYPLLATRVPINEDSIWEELEAAGYTRTPLPERMEQQPGQKEEQPLKNDDDEMAETAGKLLDRVADNTSDKFQKSQFLELMRRLRDREVRVQGDKMVDVSGTQNSSAPVPATAIPEVDQTILNHAATDFAMPIDSEQEFTNSATTTSMHPTTDERIPLFQQDLDIGRSGEPRWDSEPIMEW